MAARSARASRRRRLLGRDAAGDAGGRAARAHRAHARRASKASPTCWSATCGCARASRTWNLPCATAINAVSEVQHSANNSIRHVAIPRCAAPAAGRGFSRSSSTGRWPGPRPPGFLRGLLLLCARAAEEHRRAAGADPFLLGRHAHRDLAVDAGAAPARRQRHKLDLLGLYSQQSRRSGGAVGQANGSSGGCAAGDSRQPALGGGRRHGEWQRAPAD